MRLKRLGTGGHLIKIPSGRQGVKVMQCKIMNITGIFRTPVFVTLASNILIYGTGVLLLTPHERVVPWF